MTGRRSSRRSIPKKSYTTDAFAGIEHLIEDNEVDGERTALTADDKNNANYDEHEGESHDQNNDEDGEQDDDDDDDSEGDDAERSDDQEADDEDEVMSDIDEQDRGNVSARKKKSTKSGKPSNAGYKPPSQKRVPCPRVPRDPNKPNPDETDPTLYTRGYPAGLFQTPAKSIRRLYFFGPLDEETDVYLQLRKRHINEPCLPSRKADSKGLGGFTISEEWKREVAASRKNWAWYDEGGGREMFERDQVMTKLEEKDIQEYLYGDTPPAKRRFVAGPIDSMRLFELDPGQAMPLTAVFQEEQSRTYILRDYKRGFIMNLGERIQWLEWVPNQNDSKQYLAVAVLPRHPEDDPYAQPPAGPRSFRPQPRYKSSIQIWEFVADEQRYVDIATLPRRRMTLCMAFGDIKMFKWCAVPCEADDRLGLLACLTGDGMLRVYSIPRPPDDDDTDMNILFNEAAFTASAPNTVYTCLTWLSSSRLAAGCANGCLAIWDLRSTLAQTSRSSTSPSSSSSQRPPNRPMAYLSISTTYLLTVVSCYPTHPDILTASSMTGFVTLLDLRQSPDNKDKANLPSLLGRTALSSRSRHGVHPLIYSPLLNSTLSADDSGNLRAAPLRMHHIYCGAGREGSPALALAASFFHPFVLMGTVAGSVMCTNPTGRIVGGGKVDIWQARWFTHEWRRARQKQKKDGVPPEGESIRQGGGGGQAGEHEDDSSDGDRGLSRIVDGYKPELTALKPNSDGANRHDGVVFATIHELRAAVTALAWNCNPHVAGWAAAGLADGLLRVEDIAVGGGGGAGRKKKTATRVGR
jgi:transcription factor C subunit 6